MREQQQRRDDGSGEQNGLAIHGIILGSRSGSLAAHQGGFRQDGGAATWQFCGDRRRSAISFHRAATLLAAPETLPR
jgi:hypothetical protein